MVEYIKMYSNIELNLKLDMGMATRQLKCNSKVKSIKLSAYMEIVYDYIWILRG